MFEPSVYHIFGQNKTPFVFWSSKGVLEELLTKNLSL